MPVNIGWSVSLFSDVVTKRDACLICCHLCGTLYQSVCLCADIACHHEVMCCFSLQPTHIDNTSSNSPAHQQRASLIVSSCPLAIFPAVNIVGWEIHVTWDEGTKSTISNTRQWPIINCLPDNDCDLGGGGPVFTYT